MESNGIYALRTFFMSFFGCTLIPQIEMRICAWVIAFVSHQGLHTPSSWYRASIGNS